jgi:hypothetical protein
VSTNLTFDLREVGQDWSVLLRIEKEKEACAEELERVAAVLSESLGKTLLVRWNTTVGYRTATLYVNGELALSFGQDDELWVPLDEEGELIRDQGIFHVKDLDPDTEYDRLKSAADLGFDALGRGTSSELQDTIARWDL